MCVITPKRVTFPLREIFPEKMFQHRTVLPAKEALKCAIYQQQLLIILVKKCLHQLVHTHRTISLKGTQLAEEEKNNHEEVCFIFIPRQNVI